MKNHLKELSKWKKRIIAFSSDILLTIFAWFFSGLLTQTLIIEKISFITIIKLTLMQAFVYILCGLYRGVWRFASIPDLMRILRAVLIGTMLSFIYAKLIGSSVMISIYIIYALLLIMMLSTTRLTFRWFRDYHNLSKGKRTLIVGGGNAGESIIRDLCRSSTILSYNPIIIVDDDHSRHGCDVQGIRIVGACSDIPKLTAKYNIELILIAIPSASSKQMREIVQYCEKSKIPFRTLPSIKNIADGNITIHALREVLLEDLLGREQISLDWNAIKKTIINQEILVTGGGGSIGSELCRQICDMKPKKLIIIDNNEFNLYSIEMELSKKLEPGKLQVYLCSVTDKIAMEKIFGLHEPKLVFHVAAYKHVPLLESNVRVAMWNNIIGTKNVAEIAEKNNVKSFVLISTDKAVNPTNVMGATKRASEIFCQNYNQYTNTQFITVRFGNVLNSAGSVIPLFRKQLINGGPLTVTHRDVTRYFMTIPEASQLILQAASMKNSGDIFILDMGEPINIHYLAEQMIKLSGKVIGQDIDIEYIGLRPGEKLYEELLYENESISMTNHPKIKQAHVPHHYDWLKLMEIMQQIEYACNSIDESTLLKLLHELVPEFQNESGHELDLKEKTLNPTYSLSYV